ncbi:jg20123 [Pararge aegeria aegeria]|uniref:Hemolin n=1 Tax=Pararge aegeria aegeria TaxID=348720 RepID=A0A8S4RB54_9NEOP|nr:jg20123 [Pararge aegeria aegeria]
MDVSWDVRVQPTHGVSGGAALMSCAATAAVRPHVTVTRWFKDGAVLAPLVADAGGHFMIGGSRGDILVIREARPDDASSYSCEAQHVLTGEKRRSPSAMIAVSHQTGSMAPRILTISEDETVPQGGDIRLVCCAIGSPPPAYSWFRHANGRLSPVSNSIRISVSDQVLIVRRAQLSDSGVWTCRAHNQYGEQRRDARLRVRSRLVVSVHPQLQVANSGSSVQFNCSVEGGEARVRWLHDGVPVGGGERMLRVHAVVRAHRGMYQCFAERDLDSAQAAAELRLGDTAPELHYTFIEQALHPGPALALHCSASGSPPPRFNWLLDMQPVEEHSTAQRSISQFMSPNGDIVSYLNITSVRPDDGGRYTCRAQNTRGAVEHSTRLNVYGPPSIRNIGPVRVVAGVNTTIFCPYSGFPISDIRWQRGGLDVGSTGRALSGSGGELLLWPAEPADAGVYSCRVSAPSGQYAQKDVQIFVRNPPKIAGFSFPADLVEGSSIQVLCGITSGDKPVYFSWLKDGQHVPSNLQVQEKSLDEFSFLIFSHVTSKHSGEYTCVASNSAAEVNHTARLAVKVAPSWVYEPQDVSALLGTQIIVHCATKGYPEPRITWLKAQEPAHFEFSSRNMSVRRTASAALQCSARGDAPIQLHWTHNMQRLDLSTYRVSVSEKRSESGASSTLTVAHAQRRDSGVYRCRAENAYGRDELLIYLAVQEFPEAPRGLTVVRREGRAARLSWRRGYDGNARLRAYRLQYRVVGDARRAADWTDAPTRDLSPDLLIQRQDSPEPDSEVILEYRVDGLRPATAYALRLAAVNDIGDSEYSESVIVQTLEEAPSEAPRNVEVQADAPGELLVKWQAPSQESWNGELLGFALWCRGDNTSLALTVPGWAAAHARLAGLRAHASYEVRVRAFNAIGAGPSCAPLAATTLEDVPEAPPQHIRCEPLSAQSFRVWWEPPPAKSRGGLLLGYEIMYQEAGSLDGIWERRRSGGGEAQVAGLRAGNYSIRVAARNAAGLGPPADAYCSTLDDIPGPPADIKAIPISEDAVIVSWLAPAQKNGKIRHYTVYNRPQRSGPHAHALAPHSAEEQMLEVRGLQESQLYEFWVTAATAAGEGEMSAIVAKKPSARAGAKLWSFPRRITAAEGTRVVLSCGSAGSTTPMRVWSRRRPPTPATDPRIRIEGYRLVIPKLDASLSDNYTCTVRNMWGEERGTWELRAVPPPSRPRLRLTSAATTALILAADEANAKAPYSALLYAGFTLEYARGDGAWQSAWVAGAARAHALRRLSCGAPYRLRLTAHNAAGSSAPSDVLTAATTGGVSKPAEEKHLISSNNSCVKLNFLTWDSNSCPLIHFVISIRGFEETAWRSETVGLEAVPTALCGLPSATWYHLKVVAFSTAGTTTATYYFSTLTDDGEHIAPPAQFPSGGEIDQLMGGVMLLTAGIAALVLALSFLGIFVFNKSTTSSCFRKGYEQSGVSEEDKSVEKRDNRRNCQQVYTSSPIKNLNTKKEQQDEYTLSRAMTLMVRRTESDSDSSGSPCAECNSSVAYRMPLAPAKEEVFRAVTDSSAESCAGSGPRDKSRRRPRRHHVPNASRFQQQRQEQERRDFTIHV